MERFLYVTFNNIYVLSPEGSVTQSVSQHEFSMRIFLSRTCIINSFISKDSSKTKIIPICH